MGPAPQRMRATIADATHAPRGMQMSLPVLWPGAPAPLQFAQYTAAAAAARHLVPASAAGQLGDGGPEDGEPATPPFQGMGRAGAGGQPGADPFRTQTAATTGTPVAGVLGPSGVPQGVDFHPEPTEPSFTFPVRFNPLSSGVPPAQGA